MRRGWCLFVCVVQLLQEEGRSEGARTETERNSEDSGGGERGREGESAG